MTFATGSCRSESQINPSMNCCTPKSNGTIAKGISVFRDVIRSVTTPAAVNTVPAMKLAVAEKHIKDPKLCLIAAEECTSCNRVPSGTVQSAISQHAGRNFSTPPASLKPAYILQGEKRMPQCTSLMINRR